jgi:hypothetical protein
MTLKRKTTLWANSIIETLGGKPISSASNRRGNGGCVYLLPCFMCLGCTELIKTYGSKTSVNLAEIQSVSERENWPFRVYRVQKQFRSPELLLKITGDHREYTVFAQGDQVQVEYWRIELVKNSRKQKRRSLNKCNCSEKKRLRNWK